MHHNGATQLFAGNDGPATDRQGDHRMPNTMYCNRVAEDSVVQLFQDEGKQGSITCQYDDSTLLKQQRGVGRRSELRSGYATYTTCDTPPQFEPQSMNCTESVITVIEGKEKENRTSS